MTDAKPATDFIAAQNRALRDSLPFADTGDYDAVQRGSLAGSTPA